MGREVLRRIKKDISLRKKTFRNVAFFLDYDGTLTPIQKKPHLAKINFKRKNILKKLSNKENTKIFIISGRSLKDIKNLIKLNNLYYIGNHGIELYGPKLKYINKLAKKLKPTIQKSYAALKKNLKLKGVIVENKFYTLSVHYRLVAHKDISTLEKIFKETIKDLRKNKKIKITHGKKVFEVRPNIKWHKGKSVEWVLKKIKKSLPICIGDDITDEDTFKALGKKGLSILVSKKRRKTYAKYRLNSSEEVINLLKWYLNE